MARYKKVDYSQTVMVPVSYSKQLIKGRFEHAVAYLTDKGLVDLSEFDSFYKNDKTGSSAYSPAVLLKLVLYAYSKGILSSRKIEELSKENTVLVNTLSDN